LLQQEVVSLLSLVPLRINSWTITEISLEVSRHRLNKLIELILSTNVVEKRAALIAYTCMLEGPTYDHLEGLLTAALPMIAGMLANDQENPYVRIEAANALEATAEWVPSAYLQETLFMDLLQVLTKSIEFPPQISIHIAKLWHFLGEEIQRRDGSKFQCSSYN
jgi:hypothetical protein